MDRPDTRSRIIDAARRLFHEQGYHATGISTILREADVNSGSLYHHFAGKEALLVAVLEQYVELLEPAVMGPAEAMSSDPLGRVWALLDIYREGMLLMQYKMGCPIGNLALEVGDDHAEARRLIDLNFSNWMARVEGWLRDAGDRLPPDVDRAAIARLILTVMEGGLMQSRAALSPQPFDQGVAQLREYIDLLSRHASSTRAGVPSRVVAGGDSNQGSSE